MLLFLLISDRWISLTSRQSRILTEMQWIHLRKVNKKYTIHFREGSTSLTKLVPNCILLTTRLQQKRACRTVASHHKDSGWNRNRPLCQMIERKILLDYTPILQPQEMPVRLHQRNPTSSTSKIYQSEPLLKMWF